MSYDFKRLLSPHENKGYTFKCFEFITQVTAKILPSYFRGTEFRREKLSQILMVFCQICESWSGMGRDGSHLFQFLLGM